MKLIDLTAKAMNVLYYTLNVDEFKRIFLCTSAKKIWDKLKITHERTSQVKESKINLSIHKYKIFKIKKYESIFDIF